MEDPKELQKTIENVRLSKKGTENEERHSRYKINNPDGKRVLIHNAPFLFTANAADKITILKNHSIAIEDETIIAVRPAKEVREQDFDIVYDAGKRGGVVITPGLINTHAHPPMYLMRSAMMLDEGEAVDETIAAMPRWERAMTAADYTAATIGDFTEQQKYGVTTTLSHYGVFWPIEYAARITGQNTVNALSAVSNTHPENTTELIAELAEGARGLSSQLAVALHYLYKAKPATLKKIAEIVKNHKLLFTCHFAESPRVAAECERVHGQNETETLEKFGLLNDNSVISHAVHVSDRDIKRLADNKTNISHLPTSNTIHKSGVFKFWKFEEAGALARISLGTDGVVSKSRLDILTEAYQTRVTHLYDRTVKFGSLFKMMTANGGRAINQRDRGKLLPGFKADIAFWKLKDRGFIPYDENDPMTLIGNLITHGGRMVRDLMINGRFVIKNRRHCLVDESKLLEELQNAHMHMRLRLKPPA